MPDDQIELEELNKVQIFATGEFYGVKFDDDMLQEIADETNKLIKAKKHEPPGKLGHDENQVFAKLSGLPAIGWVKKVWREGSKLYAAFKEVPKVIKEAIDKGLYKKISSEIYPPELSLEEFGIEKWTLRAVALLGADVPKVKGMASIAQYLTDGDKRIKVIDFDTNGNALMVPANRYCYNQLVAFKSNPKEVYLIDSVIPDGTYHVINLKDYSDRQKYVKHEDLILLSETPVMEREQSVDRTQEGSLPGKEENKNGGTKVPDNNQDKKDPPATMSLDEHNRLLDAERTENAKLKKQMKEKSVEDFLKLHEEEIVPALHPQFKALALSEGGVIKLADGKEKSFTEAFIEFADAFMKKTGVDLSERADGKESKEDGKVTKADPRAIKLTEENLLAPHKDGKNTVEVGNAELAVLARDRSAKDGISYSEALRIEASLAGGSVEFPKMSGKVNPKQEVR